MEVSRIHRGHGNFTDILQTITIDKLIDSFHTKYKTLPSSTNKSMKNVILDNLHFRDFRVLSWA